MYPYQKMIDEGYENIIRIKTLSPRTIMLLMTKMLRLTDVSIIEQQRKVSEAIERALSITDLDISNDRMLTENRLAEIATLFNSVTKLRIKNLAEGNPNLLTMLKQFPDLRTLEMEINDDDEFRPANLNVKNLTLFTTKNRPKIISKFYQVIDNIKSVEELVIDGGVIDESIIWKLQSKGLSGLYLLNVTPIQSGNFPDFTITKNLTKCTTLKYLKLIAREPINESLDMLQIISQYLTMLPENRPPLEKLGFTLHEYPQPIRNLVFLTSLKQLEIYYTRWTHSENLKTLLGFIRAHPTRNYRLRSVKLEEKPIPLPTTLTTTPTPEKMTIEEFHDEIRKLNNPNVFIDHTLPLPAQIRRN